MSKFDRAFWCFFGTFGAAMIAMFAIKFGHPNFGMTWGLLLAALSGWASHGISRGLYKKELFLFGDDWNEYTARRRERILHVASMVWTIMAVAVIAFWVIMPNVHMIVRFVDEGRVNEWGYDALVLYVGQIVPMVLAVIIVFHVFGTSFRRMITAGTSVVAIMPLFMLKSTSSIVLMSLEGMAYAALFAGIASAALSTFQRADKKDQYAAFLK